MTRFQSKVSGLMKTAVQDEADVESFRSAAKVRQKIQIVSKKEVDRDPWFDQSRAEEQLFVAQVQAKIAGLKGRQSKPQDSELDATMTDNQVSPSKRQEGKAFDWQSPPQGPTQEQEEVRSLRKSARAKFVKFMSRHPDHFKIRNVIETRKKIETSAFKYCGEPAVFHRPDGSPRTAHLKSKAVPAAHPGAPAKPLQSGRRPCLPKPVPLEKVEFQYEDWRPQKEEPQTVHGPRKDPRRVARGFDGRLEVRSFQTEAEKGLHRRREAHEDGAEAQDDHEPTQIVYSAPSHSLLGSLAN